MSATTVAVSRVRRRQGFARPRNVAEVLVAAVLVVLLAGGVAMLGAAYWQVGRHIQSLDWTPVPARVLSVREDHAKALGTRLTPWPRRIVGTLAYAVDGRLYTTERLSFSYTRDRSLDTWWRDIQDALGADDTYVQVWVNPNDPADAVFERGVRWTEIAILLGVGSLLVFAGYQFLFGTAVATATPPAFSWRVVGGMGVVGVLGLVLAPLLWRDAHGVWAAVACLPACLALVGVINGLRMP